MSVHSKGIRRSAGSLITRIKESLPLLAADEQTRLSWLKVVRSYAEAPEVYRSSFTALVGDRPFPYSVLTPSFAGFMNREPEKLVCYLDGKIYVWEEVTGGLSCIGYAIKDISYVEVGKALLQAWVKISGLADNGRPSSAEFKFNTTTDYLFTPIVNKIRSAPDDAPEIDPNPERSKFNYLNRTNLKLTNYAKRSLLLDETVEAIILQPEIRDELIKLFGNALFRAVCLAHLSILTDRELILIQDGTGQRWGGDIRYGGVWHYVPLDKITTIALTGPADNLLTMSVQLPESDNLTALFSVSNQQEVDNFLRQIAALRAGENPWAE